jgi:hypothetical protein
MGSAAQRIASAPIESLGNVELIERLALSLQRRRAQAEAVVVATLPETHLPQAPVAEAVTAEPEADIAEPEAPAVTATAFTAPIFAASPFAMPATEAPLSFAAPRPEFARLAAEAPVAAQSAAPQPEPIVPAPMALPAALRPITFDDDHSHDDDLASILPPRSFAMPPVMPAAEEVAAEAEEIAETAVEPLAVSDSAITDSVNAEPDDIADEDLDDGYSSLLDISRPVAPRQQFVRIDEPESDVDAIEPVVIFPGQAAQIEAQPVADLGAAPRRFDAPGSTGSAVNNGGQPFSLNPVVQQDPEETARALRAALTNLQRMSGAA